MQQHSLRSVVKAHVKASLTIKHRSDESFGVLIDLFLVALWPKHLVILVLLAAGGAGLLNCYLQTKCMLCRCTLTSSSLKSI